MLRHAHGYRDADPARNHPDAIPEEDVLQEVVLPVFLGLGAVDEVNF